MNADRQHPAIKTPAKRKTLVAEQKTLTQQLQRHANAILLGIAAIAALIFIIRYRINTNAARQSAVLGALVTARQGPPQLRLFETQPASAQQIAMERAQVIAAVSNGVDTVLSDAEGDDGAPFRAEALIAKGDLNWQLANLPQLHGAATQPTLQLPRSADDYLKAAEGAYHDVVGAYSSQTMSWVSAQFGLAAIAENRRDWESAKQAYAAIAANNAVDPVFQQEAQGRLAILPQLSTPVLLGQYPATQPTTATASMPATLP